MGPGTKVGPTRETKEEGGKGGREEEAYHGREARG